MIPKVSIIILNWNGWKDTIECLESLYQIDYPNYDVIVVDNASSDNSIQKIIEYCKGNLKTNSRYFRYDDSNKPIQVFEYSDDELNKPKKTEERYLTLIKSSKNYGFAEGNNIGIEYTLNMLDPDYILLSNNDTFVKPDFLNEAVKVAENDKKIGSVQSLLLKPGGKLSDSLGQEVLIIGGKDIGIGFNYDKNLENMEIFGACAAASLYKTEVLKKTGIFDRDFFVVYEDLDLSWRLRLSGYKSVLAVNSVVFHNRGLSNPEDDSDFIKYHKYKNLLIMGIRYSPDTIFFNRKHFFHFLSIFGECLKYSFKTRNLFFISILIIKNLKLRSRLKENPLLKITQENWIKDEDF